MAQMPFYGTIPAKQSDLARVLGGGVEAYGMGAGLKLKREAGEREKERLKLAGERLDIDLKNIEYAKKRDTAKMVIDVAKTLDPSAAKAFVEEPMVKALFEDLEWPLPTELHVEEDFQKTAQEYVARGEAMPNMTMDETKKAAGILVPELKITGEDIKGAKKDVPWWEYLMPGAQSKEGKEYRELKRRRRERLLGPSGAGGLNDPLGAR